MQIKELTPKKALNKAYLKVKPNRTEIERFKTNLIQLLNCTNTAESEEFHKNLLSDFLKNTYYAPAYFINTKGRNDLVIHNGAEANHSVGVIIETKSPLNRSEMVSRRNLNTKAFQELVLYYLRERITHKNLEVRHLVITNVYEWFVFDVSVFEKNFAQNKAFVQQFLDFEGGRLAGTNTDFFYRDVAEPFIAQIKADLEITYFDLRSYEAPLRNQNKKDDNKLIALFKFLSPEHLLKLPFTNDSNSLDKRFYTELLYIIGLSETRQGGKKLIGRNPEGERPEGSILENAITQLDSLDKIHRLHQPGRFGHTHPERLFQVALELSITWINRILFLKLLEAQLISYHKGDISYAFLTFDRIQNYDDLNSLFFQVLARPFDERSGEITQNFSKIPYLNSSLFEPTDTEHATLLISNLRDDKTIPIPGTTVLKDEHGRRRSGHLNTLQYLFEFLNSYDFSSEGSEEIQEENKTLINASVLGLIFEKINGYKDGSFFTPGFITMYMCRETIRRAVVQKFNDTKGWNCQTLEDVYDKIDDRQEANEIVNSIKICDPAVGSGHFLVSALNEMIAIKSDLKILQDKAGRRLKEYYLEVVNDELIVTDEDGELFEYTPVFTPGGILSGESQRVQEALFHEKQTIIENCLFGVDINANSVKICRLRLWIELLKNAYYKTATALETLPNIEINIKQGNSLVSRFAIDADLKKALKKSKWSIESYRVAVATYRNAESKEQKREMERLIADIKSDFRSEISLNDPKIKKLSKLRGDLTQLTLQTSLFQQTPREKAAWNKQVSKVTADIKKLETEIEVIKNNQIFDNAFEWRFEFPEVLDDDGNFIGFDVVIGNPPYIRQEELQELKPHLKLNYRLYTGTSDIYIYFIEKGFSILRERGIFSYIMPNKFMQAGYGRPARRFLLEQTLLEIIDFGDIQVFEEATTYPCIVIARKEVSGRKFNVTKIESTEFKSDFYSFIQKITTEKEHSSLTEDTWVMSNSNDQVLLEKITAIGEKLENYLSDGAKRGVLTGLTEAFLINNQTRNEILTRDTRSDEIMKPVLRGRDVKKWHSKAGAVWLIATFPAKRLNIDEYQGVKKFFLDFGKHRLEQTGNTGSRKKTSNQWFETQDTTAYYREFEKPKIMYQKFQIKPCFSYDTEGLYCNDSMWFIPTEDKVLLGVLNSKIGWWLISKYCTAIQNGFQLIWKYFSQIPIVRGNDEIRFQIEALVNHILDLRTQNALRDVSELESQIDQLVYQLYELTDEEIAIIEESTK